MSYKFVSGRKMFFEKGKLSYTGNGKDGIGILAAVYDPESNVFSYSKEYDQATALMGHGRKAYASI